MLPIDYSIRNLGRSPLRLVLSVSGSALVALLAITSVGFVVGMNEALGTSGRHDNIMLVGAGSEESLERSEISPQVGEIVAADADGIASAMGIPLVSPQVHVALPVGPPEAGTVALFRGITAPAFLVHPQVRVVSGRAPDPGTDEIALGREAAAMLGRAGLAHEIGGALHLEGRSLSIVGLFAAPGTVFEGEIWMNLQSLKIATQRTTDSCVIVGLVPEGDIADLEALAAVRLDLELAVVRESDYFATLGSFLAPVRWLVMATALLVTIGGLLGGVIVMDAAFASRVREFGTLQALGFRRRAIVRSLFLEATLASFAGGLIAAAIAFTLVDGLSVRSTMGAFAVRVDLIAIAAGLVSGLLLGVVGAIVPAGRCLRLPIPVALKAAT
ncbi:MAG: ABC transporter permease [Phycisphaerae bacterium]|nr:ABC transporter permease [Phycisphaerae bacterium]